MIIMTQDKEACYNTDNAFGIWMCKRGDGTVSVRIFDTCEEDDDTGHLLGLYASEDRAKEVLRLVHTEWCYGGPDFEMPAD